MENKIKLKPCPFCAGDPEIKINKNSLLAQGHCNKCGITIKKNYKDSVLVNDLLSEWISEEWNRRHCDETD